MKIKTNVAIDNTGAAITKTIAKFWNKTSLAWRDIWGIHIHHGYFENDETPAEAQIKLLDKLSQLCSLNSGSSILDVGCGMGGSSIYLAKKFQAEVSGISLSHKQLEIAKDMAQQEPSLKIAFLQDDAHVLKNFGDGSFDVVWSLESCEQFYDKALFIKQAYRVLKPGGKLMLATWCTDREEFSGKLATDYLKICKAFDTPYMPTLGYYNKLLQNTDFQSLQNLDWSNYVKNSWSIGMAGLRNVSPFKLLKYVGIKEIIFLLRIKLMQRFFQKGYIRYGVFIAQKSFE